MAGEENTKVDVKRGKEGIGGERWKGGGEMRGEVVCSD